MRRSPALNLRIASPCSVAWDEMQGGSRVRFCNLCDKQVFNISHLTRDEVEALIIAHAGKLCVTYYQRSDGTIMLKDCTYHEQRGGWLPAIAAASLFGAAVIATPPTDDDQFLGVVISSGGLGGLELPVSDSLQAAPVIVVKKTGDVTYRGQLVATADSILRDSFFSIDALYELLDAEATETHHFEEPPPPWDRALIVQAHESTDMRVIDKIRSTAERAGFYMLYAMKND